MTDFINKIFINSSFFQLTAICLLGLYCFPVVSSIYVVDDDFPSTCEAPAGAIFGGDLSTAITLAAANASPPHTIRVCAGTYNETANMLLTNANLIDLTIEGALQGIETNLDVDIVGLTADIFDIRIDGVTFRDFETTAGRFAFETSANGTNLSLERITINDTTNDSIRLNAIGVVLIDVDINNAGDGLGAGRDGIQGTSTSGNLTSTNLNVSTASGSCVLLNGAGPNVLNNTSLSNCTTDGLLIGANGDQSTIDDITVDTTVTRDCLLLQGDDITLSNALLENCARRGMFLTINGGGTLLNVSNVTVNNTGSVGIEFRNANAANPGDVVIDGLMADDAGNVGILFRNITNAQITDFISTNAASHGVQVRNGDFSSYSSVTLTQNLIQDSGGVGLFVTNNANDNILEDFLIQDNVNDGIQVNNSKRNRFTDITISVDDGTNNDGVVIANNSNQNTFDNVNVSDVAGDCVRLDDGNRLTYINSTLSNCGDFGIDASPLAETIMLLENIDVSNTINDGLLVQNFNAGNVLIRDITITDSADRGISLVTSSGVVLQDFVVTGSLADGLVLSNADNNIVTTSALANNIITGSGDATNDNGVEFVTGSDGNTISNLNVINSFDDAIRISTSLNNNFTDVAISNPVGNANDGVTLNSAATGNSFTDLSIDGVVDDCFDTRADNTSIINAVLTNCVDMGLLAIVAAGTTLNLNNIDVIGSGDDAVFIQNFTLGTGITVNDLTVVNSGDIGMQLNTVNGGTFTDLDIQGSTRFGLLLVNADNTDFGVSSLLKNNITGNDDGIQLQTGSDGNVLSDFIVSNSADDGFIFNSSNNNLFTNSDVNNNGDLGILVTTSSTGNTVSNNIIVENIDTGLRIFNTGTSINNTFFDNCIRNIVNINNGETGGTNNFDDGARGNFWGSLPIDGTGFSESCEDNRVVNDDICDSAFIVLDAGASVDNFPLQQCQAFGLANPVTVQKVSTPIDDNVNVATPKAIPGAIVRYTVTVTNANTDARSGMAEGVMVTDDLDNEITTEQNLIWQTNSIIRTTPDYNAGVASPLTDDAADSDDADFDNTPGNRTVNAVCGDINAGITCTITYDVMVN